MEIDEAICAYLLARPGLTALIDRRFYFDTIPKDMKYPAVMCQFISNMLSETHDGIVDLENPILQFTSYATTRAGARAVSKQLRTALCDYSGTLSGIVVPHIVLKTDLPAFVVQTDGAVSVCVVIQEYQVNFIRS